jgi:Ca2+-binding RTX toxin-like protein
LTRGRIRKRASGEVTIRNTDGNQFGILLVDAEAGGCYFVDNNQSCPPSYGDIQATYGGGSDTFQFFSVCFPTATINMGNGNNDYRGQGCDASTITVSGGSGQDLFNGYANVGATVEVLNGGGGDDNLFGGAGDDVIHGGDGQDSVDGSIGNDRVFGDGGSDDLYAREGNDIEDGGPGDDRIGWSSDDDQGADDVRGGDGSDDLRLNGHTGGMTISLDDQANDGSSGEGDNIHSDIELIEGTGANDSFTGSPGPDTFNAGNGADTISGGGGGDTLSGDSGNDQVFGDAGNDTVYGSFGDDRVDGGGGTDSVFGDSGSCSAFSCPSGNDQLFIRDGELDQANCGPGADTVQADQLDVVSGDGFQACEAVDRQTVAGPAGPAGAGGPGGGASALGLVVARSIKLKALFSRGLTLRLNCAAACTVVAELRYKGKKIGAGRKTLRKAGTARLAVRIGRKARRKVRRLTGKTLTLRVKVTSAGATTTLTRKVTLKR